MLSQHRDWAIGYARAGIPVFPLAPREKVPLLSVSEGGRGFRDATTDTDQIDMWWRAWPDANIGATPLVGNRVRHAVIDIDVQNGGDQSWERLISEHGEPPATLTARTGQGGAHLWFWVAERGRSKLAQGIDCKFGDLGYVVVPPSVHPITHRIYTWDCIESVAIAPDWLRRLIRRPTRTVTASVSKRYTPNELVSFVRESVEGDRNSRLFWAACRSVENGTFDRLRESLGQAALATGLTDDEIESVFRSAQGRVT